MLMKLYHWISSLFFHYITLYTHIKIVSCVFLGAVKRGIENASFEDKRKITELLVEEIIMINGKVEIIHIGYF
jgi:hypothetical protein